MNGVCPFCGQDVSVLHDGVVHRMRRPCQDYKLMTGRAFAEACLAHWRNPGRVALRIQALLQHRCVACEREPTREEVEEMARTFDHDPDEALVWRCGRCQRRTGVA